MKIDRITFSVERVINTGNYESVRVKAELSGSTDDYKSDLKTLKKEVYKQIDTESERVLKQYANNED